MKASLIILIIVGGFQFLVAQPLQRKAYLGAELSLIDNRLTITRINGGTAESLQIMEGDIMLSINGIEISDRQSITNILSQSKEGDQANFQVLRTGKTKKLNGKFIGRPRESSLHAEVIYDHAAYKEGKLGVIINKPDGEKSMPAMLFIPGYTCSSIDNLSDNHPYKRIIDAFNQAGFVTLRIEKSGLGDSQNTPACESCDLLDEIANFEVGLQKLKSLPYVDTSKIIIFGHSMGGIIAPAIGAKNGVAGVVVYGTTAKSWFEYQIEMVRIQNQLAGLDPIAHEQSVRDQYELNYRYFVKKESLTDIAKDSLSLQALITTFQYDPINGRLFGRNAEYWRQIQDINHLENWKNIQAQVLVQYGESDFQAFSRADHEQIVNTCNYYNEGSAALHVFPLTDHYFAKSGTMQDAYDKFMNRQILQLFNEYNFDVGHSAVNWSLKVVHPQSIHANVGWTKLDTEPYPGKQDDICFINEQIGWYVNGFGKVFHTKNGGITWEKLYEQKGSFFRAIAFMDQNIGFLGTVGTDYFPNVSDTIPLYKTTDGGLSWTPVAYDGPYVKGLCAINIVREPFINHGVTDYKIHLFAVGRVGSPANIMISNDGGETWNSHSLQHEAKMLFDIYMFDKNKGIACAASDENIAYSNALILKTEDGGKNWKKVYQSSRPFETTWKVSFPTPNIGYVTIQSYNPDPNVKQQRIAKTTDGGNTWEEIDLIQDALARQFGIGFLDENHGFVGTMSSGFETKDGGKTWSPIDLGRACNKINLYKDSNGNPYGYSIGADVFKLTNKTKGK